MVRAASILHCDTVVASQARFIRMKSASKKRAPTIVNLTVKRRYLTQREIERLMDCAEHGRYGHRDATMILVAYRHGVRASEVCDLQWQQIELAYIRSAGTRCERCASYAATIPKTPTSSFPSAAGQSVLLASTASSSASARLPKCHSQSPRTCCAMPVGSSSPTMATTRGPSSTTSGTRTFSTLSGTPRWHPTGSRIFGANWRRQARDNFRFPLNYLGGCSSVPLGELFLDELNRPLDLLRRHLLVRVGMLQRHLPRDQMRADLQVCRGVLLPHLCNGFRTVTLEVGGEREQEILIERSTRSLQ